MNDVEIGSLTADDADGLDAYSSIVAWAFGIPVHEAPPWLRKAGVENVRIARRGSHVAGGLIQIPMGQWYCGRSVPMTGIAGVAVAPEHRGRGAALALMRASLAELSQRGEALSVLYPATLGLYRKAGYEPAGSRFRCSLRPADIPVGPRDLAVRPAEPGDHDAITAMYSRAAREQNGYLDRGAYIWDRVRWPRAESAHGYVVEGDNGIEGYLYVFQRRAQHNHYDLAVSDACATTARAGRCLLGLIAEHRTLGDSVSLSCGAADPLLALLPERYQVELADHWMLRIIDVTRALTLRGYPAQLAARLELEVEDADLAHNTGRFVVEVANGRATVARGGAGALRTSERGLAALYSGFMHPAALARAGLLVGDEPSFATAAALFAGPAPCMRDGF